MTGLSVNQICHQTGAHPEEVKRWIELEGIKPLASKQSNDGRVWARYSAKRVLALVKSRQRPKGKFDSAPNIDPETGLTWAQKELKEKAIALERENRIAQKLEDKEYMPTSLYLDHARAIVNRLEQIPMKLKSELGLSDSQFLGLRRAIDSARQEAADEIQRSCAI